MVAVTVTLDLANNQALDVFDSITHMAFGNGTTTPNISQTSLVNELLRTSLESSTKDIGSLSYTFVGRIPLTQLDGSTITELGLFNTSTGGDMALRTLTPVNVTKTPDTELLYTIVVKVNTINN